MSFVLGLTGPTGSGKSTAGIVAAEQGWYVIDCDKVAREATDKKETLSALASAFGSDILNKDGSLNRKILAQKAFSTPEKTELLNQTVLPIIVELIKQKISDNKDKNILLDAPTLFESGADSLCDAVCAILSSDEKRLARITARDKIDISAAKLRMSAGKPDEYYKSRTRHIIYNNGDEAALVAEFKNFLLLIGGN